jgi:hypothetical protein
MSVIKNEKCELINASQHGTVKEVSLVGDAMLVDQKRMMV